MAPFRHDRTIIDRAEMLAGKLWHLVYEREHETFIIVFLRGNKTSLKSDFNYMLDAFLGLTE